MNLDVIEERIAAQLPGDCAYFCFTVSCNNMCHSINWTNVQTLMCYY